MTETVADMRQRLHAQEAWGKWNTADLANHIRDAERAAMSPLRRRMHEALDGAVDATALVAGYAITGLMLWRLVSAWTG